MYFLCIRNLVLLIWVLWLRFSHKAASKVSAELQSSPDSVGNGSISKFMHMVVGQRLATVPACGSWDRAVYNMHACFSRASGAQSYRESARETEVTAVYNLTSETTSCHLFCILFIRSHSLDPAHTPGEGITQGHEHQQWVIGGNPREQGTKVKESSFLVWIFAFQHCVTYLCAKWRQELPIRVSTICIP